jgi:E3 ubiquitin-protein ligase DOA10
LSDCLEGQIITGFVIIIFVAAYLFREWVMQNLPAEQQIPLNEPVPVNINNQNNNEQLVQEQVAIDTLLTAMQVINPQNEQDDEQDMNLHRIEHQLGHLRNAVDNELAQRNNNDDSLDNWYVNHASSSSANDNSDVISIHDDDEDEEYGYQSAHMKREPLDNEEHERLLHEDNDNPFVWNAESSSGRMFEVEEEEDEEEEEDQLPDLIDPNRGFNNTVIERMFQEQMDRRRELARIRELEQMDEVPPMVQPHQPPAAAAGLVDDDEPFDVGDDINGVLEAIGMRGNPWMLVQNSVLMSLMISLCLGIAVWVPYVIGRLVILVIQ